VGHKNVSTNFWQYLRQILTDFKNRLTVTLCEKFARAYWSKRTWLLWMNWYCQVCQTQMHRYTPDRRVRQSSVVWIIYRNVGLKCFFCLPKRLFASIVSFSYVHILQGSVETHLRRGGIYNNCFIANCPYSVSVENFWKSVDNWRIHGQSLGGTFFYGPRCRTTCLCFLSSLENRVSICVPFKISTTIWAYARSCHSLK